MKRINKYLIFAFLIAFVTLLLTSKNSFLYVFNNWVDANTFFTLGKSMFNGVVPYKDLFEQKGPFLYLIYGIGYLISNRSFHGVFILEVISFTIFLYYIHKIIIMYFDKKYSLLILPGISMILCISIFFVHGGSCEEFCLPLMAISLYYYFKHFKVNNLNKKEILFNGFIAGLILMTKYTLLGFWIGFCLFICINYLRKKEIKNILIYCGLFLLGMLIPFSIGLIYFLINNGVKDFINVYFIFNMTAYSNNESVSILNKITGIFIFLFKCLNEVRMMILILFLILLSFLSKEKDKLFRLSLVGLVFFLTFFILFGQKSFVYYYLPIFAIIIILLILFILKLAKKYLDLLVNDRIMIGFSIFFICAMIFMSYFFANYKEEITYKKEDYFQYKYAKYINKHKDQTLLNMGYIDLGVYTLADIIPNTKYYEQINISRKDFSELYESMESTVKNKKVHFIVYAHDKKSKIPPEYIYNNYKLIYKDNYIFEGRNFTAYLFELK